MPCFQPLAAFIQPKLTKNGAENTIIWASKKAVFNDLAKPINLPCGQCIGCRLERSRRWAVRLMHEKQLHEKASFITLTYDESKVPSDGSLKVEDFQNFMHRLRKRIARDAESEGVVAPRIRFFHCGEYGETTKRPHYHAIIFGEDFADDRIYFKTTAQGDKLYNSQRLSEVWGLGHAVIGELTFESAAYVARYCLKKVTGDAAPEHYQGRKPEYVTMSRRPGIGAGWYEKYAEETYRSDSVVMRGKEMLPPPFYDKLLEKVDPELFKRIKRERSQARTPEREMTYEQWLEDLGPRRLQTKEYVKEQTIQNTLRRSVE